MIRSRLSSSSSSSSSWIVSPPHVSVSELKKYFSTIGSMRSISFMSNSTILLPKNVTVWMMMINHTTKTTNMSNMRCYARLHHHYSILHSIIPLFPRHPLYYLQVKSPTLLQTIIVGRSGKKRGGLTPASFTKYTNFSTEAYSFPIKDKLDVPVLYQYLNLHTFTSQEIHNVFTRIQSSSSSSSSLLLNDAVPPNTPSSSLSPSSSSFSVCASMDCITLHHVHQFLIQQIHSTLHDGTTTTHLPIHTNNDNNTNNNNNPKRILHPNVVPPHLQQNIHTLAQEESYRFFNTFQPIWEYKLLFVVSQPQEIQDGEQGSREVTNTRKEEEEEKEDTKKKKKKFEKTFPPSSSSSSLDFKPPYLYRQAFITHIQSLASTINYTRSIPIALNMFVVGSSVGMIVPMMPYFVYELGLSTGQYGYIIGSFAIAKCLGNIPCTIGVERYGRKPILTYSLIIIGCGVGMMGYSTLFEHLILCRLCTGLGVAALSTAATLSMTDISTSLNRASTIAPIMSSFAAGTAIGPALGGLLADTIGIHSTFSVVGSSYIVLAIINRTILNETQIPSLHQRLLKQVQFLSSWKDNQSSSSSSSDGTFNKKDGLSDAIRNSIAQWSPLLSDTKVRNVVLMNGIYWVALAGSQMTILPLFLTDPSYGFALSATQVGKVYMGMSLVQVLGNPILAKLIDKMGKTPAIVMGCSLLSSTMFALPFCTNMTQLATTLGLWALGSTLLSTAPVSFLADKVPDDKRAQAVALLRTAGDIGLLSGASSSGILAEWYNMDVALHSSSALLFTTTFWFATRYYLSSVSKVP